MSQNEPTLATKPRAASLTEQLVRDIERMIVSGELAPGARINEAALAARLGVSRAPVREACRTLASSGLVTIVPNQGAFVRSPSLHEIVNLFEIRAALGRLAGQLAAGSIDRAGLDRLRSLISEMDAAAAADDAERYTSLNIAFHSELYGATRNERLATLDRALGTEMRIYRRHGLAFGGGLAVSNQEHRAILASIERGNVDEAGSRLERHILNGRDRYLRAMSTAGQLVLRDDSESRSRQRKADPSR